MEDDVGFQVRVSECDAHDVKLLRPLIFNFSCFLHWTPFIYLLVYSISKQITFQEYTFLLKNKLIIFLVFRDDAKTLKKI